MRKIVVFASGNGSNFTAIVEAVKSGKLHAEIVGLICDQPKAYVLQRASEENIPATIFVRSEFSDKNAMETAMLNQLIEWHADWLVLAGYMRILGEVLLRAYPRHIINIHPSLLPKYRGKDAIGQAIDAHAKIMGITIHYVDEGMDTGESIAQFMFEVNEGEDRASIEHRIHALEHQKYPAVLQTLMEESK